MSIAYAGGTIVFENAWAQSTGTKTELCSRIYENFITAGWSSVSVTGGSGARTAFTVRSAVTSGGSLQCEVKCDTASTNCVRLYMQEYNAQHPQTGGMWLLPAIGYTWFMVINQFQFFIWAKGSLAQSRSFAAGGVLYLPTFLQGVLTICIWGHGNGRSDTDTTASSAIASFRTGLDLWQNLSVSNSYNNLNGIWWENNSSNTGAHLTQRLYFASSACQRWSSLVNAQPGHRWHHNAGIISDSLMGFAPRLVSRMSTINGQLFDSFITSQPLPGDLIIPFDGHNFITLTQYQCGGEGVQNPGTLLLATT